MGSIVEVGEESLYTISAQIIDEEHSLNDIDIEFKCFNGDGDCSDILSNEVINASSGIVSIDFETPFPYSNSYSHQ